MSGRRLLAMRNPAPGVSGSSLHLAGAGNSSRPVGLLRNPPKGVK